MPEFATVTWGCGSCGWQSDPDDLVAQVVDEPSSDSPGPEAVDAQNTATPYAAVEVSDTLTDHERATVKRVAAGSSNQEIAEQLAVSITTVSATIRAAYRKMKVDTRIQAMLWVAHHGLVDPTDPP
jgi:DNA-binding NarL/FixJ family response regulator